jgi:hypothetical protein
MENRLTLDEYRWSLIHPTISILKPFDSVAFESQSCADVIVAREHNTEVTQTHQ